MKQIILLSILLLATSPLLAQTNSVQIKNLTWLSGCWQSKNGIEQWSKPTENIMLGASYTVKNGKAIEWEFMRIETDDKNQIFFVALLPNQPETRFKLISSTPQNLIFENPEHDFPQRVIYKLAEKTKLQARIEGTMNGKTRGMDYPMNKVPC